MEEAAQHPDKQPSLQRLIKRLDIQSITQLKQNLNHAAYISAYPAQKLYLQNIQMLMNGVPTQSLADLKELKEKLEEQVGKMVSYRKKVLESRMRIVGLAQYKARLEQVQQLYRQLSTAVEILDKK